MIEVFTHAYCAIYYMLLIYIVRESKKILFH